MGPLAAIAACYRRFAVLRGRARRSEFWWFQLFAAVTWVVAIAAMLLMWGQGVEGTLSGPAEDPVINPDAIHTGWITAALGVGVAYAAAVALPGYTAAVRRLHDMGQSGWWLLLSLVGLGIVPLVLCAFPGQRGANRYGPDPQLAAQSGGVQPGGVPSGGLASTG